MMIYHFAWDLELSGPHRGGRRGGSGLALVRPRDRGLLPRACRDRADARARPRPADGTSSCGGSAGSAAPPSRSRPRPIRLSRTSFIFFGILHCIAARQRARVAFPARAGPALLCAALSSRALVPHRPGLRPAGARISRARAAGADDERLRTDLPLVRPHPRRPPDRSRVVRSPPRRPGGRARRSPALRSSAGAGACRSTSSTRSCCSAASPASGSRSGRTRS